MRACLPSLVLALALARAVLAQSFTASLQGTVADTSGAVIPGATVTLLNEATDTHQAAKTNSTGRYLFVSVPSGTYRFTVEAAGFKSWVRGGVELQVQQAASVDVVLIPGDVSTTVVVTGEAPRLDTADATLGRVVDNVSIRDMPLGNRNAMDLVMLAAGVAGSGGSTGTNFVVNGSRNSQSDVLMDGTTLTVTEQNGGITDLKFRPSVDVVREFKVQTNTFSAEYGSTGGGVVNVVSMSGTNQFHGSLSEYLRNSALNANGFFSNRVGTPMVPFRRNQHGGTMGGPAVIPHVLNGRNRTFFFFNYEGTRQSSQATTLDSVPTMRERTGDFSQTFDVQKNLIQIFDPWTPHSVSGKTLRDPFPGNIIPASRFDPVGVKAASYYPVPNVAGRTNLNTANFYGVGSSISDGYQTSIKIDHTLNDYQRVSVRFSRAMSIGVPPNLWGNDLYPLDGGPSASATHNATADYTATLSPSVLLNLRWGLIRQSYRRDPFSRPFPEEVARAFGFQGPLNVAMVPRFSPEDYRDVGSYPSARMRRGEDTNHFAGSLVKIRGIQSLKFGAEARLARLNYAQPGLNNATLSFTRRVTMQDADRANSQQGNAIASMLLGWGSGGSQTTGMQASSAARAYGFYANDDIQLTRALFINIGLRYELDIPRTERYNRYSWFDPDATSPLNVPGFANLKGGLRFADPNHRSVYDLDANNLAPRFGLALRVSRKTVMRGGYGIYYGISRAGVSGSLTEGYRTSTNWTVSLDGNRTLLNPLRNPFPAGTNEPPGNSLGLLTGVGLYISAPVREWGTKPYYQQWSFTLQRELPLNAVAELAYSASRGVHLYHGGMNALNRLPETAYGDGDGSKLYVSVSNPFYGIVTDRSSSLSQPRISISQLWRPYPQFTGVSGDPGPPVANSIYHAVQVKLTKRWSRGLSFSGHYTFSKMIDDNSVSAVNLTWLGGNATVQSVRNLRLERSVSTWDVNHRAVADFSWQMPIGRGKRIGTTWKGWADHLMGQWQLNGIAMRQSGFPLVPALSGSVLVDSSQRPNLIGDPNLPVRAQDKLDMFVNPAAFSRPDAYKFGTAARTLPWARGAGTSNLDLSLFKNFYLWRERRRYLQFRGESFNITNSPMFASPDMTVGSTRFGLVTAQSNSSRQFQLALKFYF
jgi:hypothetical protein